MEGESLSAQEVRDLLKWAENSSLRHLSLRAGNAAFEYHAPRTSLEMARTAAKPDLSPREILSPVAGRFFARVQTGDELNPGAVIGQLDLFRTSRMVVSEDGGRLRSLSVADGQLVECGDLLAIVDAVQTA